MSLEINYKVRWLRGNPLPDKSPLCFSRLEEAGTLLMGTQATGLGPPWCQTLSLHRWGEARGAPPLIPPGSARAGADLQQHQTTVQLRAMRLDADQGTSAMARGTSGITAHPEEPLTQTWNRANMRHKFRSRQEGDTAIAVFWTAKEDQVANKGRGNTFQ